MTDDRGHLDTEQRHCASESLDRLSISDAFDVIHAADAGVAEAVAAARNDVCLAIELVVQAWRVCGRLIYVGAGTSGRLGVLDAAECPPTFCSDPNMVQGIIAGGDAALQISVEGAEDRAEDGAAAVAERGVDGRDVVMGIATGGTTPYVHGAIDAARQRGAKTIFFACVPKSQVEDRADVSIRVITGPEVLTGSTRMKAGTATKMVLNTITTIAMARIGKVYGNLMVDVNSRVNTKLVDRGIRMICTVTGTSREQAADYLHRANGHVKTAIVMRRKNVDCATAEQFLKSCDGHLHRIIGENQNP